ncbi:MAG: sensor histidine kinase [Lachnospiraceae bacterium]|jgi:two-component system sensor histidine kinase AgrC|nr:sensor histidine kinase [Lachnospiraceae bacterium]
MYNELQWTIMSHLAAIAEMAVTGFFYAGLTKPFLQNKRGAYCTSAVYFGVMLVFYIFAVRMDYYLINGIAFSAGFGVLCWIDRQNYAQKVFLTVTFFSLHWFVFEMAEILYDNIYRYAEQTKFMAAHLDLWLALYVSMLCIHLAAKSVLTAISNICIIKAYTYKQAKMSKRELLMLCVPSVTGMAGFEILRYYRDFYIRAAGKSIESYEVLALLYYAVSVAAVVVVVMLYQSIWANQREKLQNELLAAQMGSIQQHIRQVEYLYQDIRSMKHDMANHLLMLERLYAGNKAAEAKAYSAELSAAFSEAAGELRTGNPVTDVILQEQKNEAQNRNLEFHSAFQYPSGTTVNAFDVSIILNNALQNAVEYAVQYVVIRAYRKNNAYIIEVKNDFAASLKWDTESGLPATSKQREDGHGYGLSNIRRVAGKYAGDLDITINQDEFCLTVLLMLESA